jgi:multidrug resistance protein, MATE family
MNQTYTLRQKIKQLLFVLLPILGTQVAMFAMSFFDVFMAGHYSPVDLAGVAIGASLWVPVQTGLSGILLAVTPIVAQLAGANRKDSVPFKVVQALYVSVLLSIAVIVIGIFTVNPILSLMRLEAEVESVAREFLTAIAMGIPGLFLYTVLRCFIDALGHTRTSMYISFVSLPVNGLLNYLFIYGKMGLPELGGAGAGVASAITYWVIFLIAWQVVARIKPFTEYAVVNRFYRISLADWKELLTIGLPIGLSIFFEVSIFAAVTMLMSEYSTMTIAAHQAAINFASFLYMIPLSISMALTILIGFEVGARRYRDARIYGRLGIGFALGMAGICTVILLLFTKPIAGIYTGDPELLELTGHFLLYAIFFQLSDAVAAPIQGALRGYKDVNVTFMVALISYWVVGLPFGYILAHYTEMGPFGYWIGLSTGLTLGAIGLFIRLVRIQKKVHLPASSGS